MALTPRTYASEVLEGSVSANGGHAKVAAELGGDTSNLTGFSILTNEEGVEVGFKSGVLNPEPNYVAPPEVQQQIVNGLQDRGVIVTNYFGPLKP